MQSLRKKCCGVGTRDCAEPFVLKRKGCSDLAKSCSDLAGPYFNPEGFGFGPKMPGPIMGSTRPHQSRVKAGCGYSYLTTPDSTLKPPR